MAFITECQQCVLDVLIHDESVASKCAGTLYS